MKIVIISNAFTPHQLPLCDALAERIKEFRFIEADNIDKTSLPLGWRELRQRNYVVSYDYLIAHKTEIEALIMDADAVIMSGDRTRFVRNRLKQGLLTFIYSERIYKNNRDRIKWPFHFLKYQLKYNRYPNLYLLSAGAFAYGDFKSLNCFKRKAFKWGYFPPMLEEVSPDHPNGKTFKMLYAARFINWKHPELAVYLVNRLRQNGYDCELDMYGDGPELPRIKELIGTLNLEAEIHLHGAVPNTVVLSQMPRHHAFILTSDSNEGWGAVANEAMGNRCALVASCNIGSVPYLVKNRSNGCIFKENDIDSLTEQVEWFINNPVKRKEIVEKGYETVRTKWSAESAAHNLLRLIADLQHSKPSSIQEGPCSLAEIVSNNWFKSLCQ